MFRLTMLSVTACRIKRSLGRTPMPEAMSTHRPYRAALGLAIAIEEIKKEAGTKLDTNVVNAACKLMQDGKLEELLHNQ